MSVGIYYAVAGSKVEVQVAKCLKDEGGDDITLVYPGKKDNVNEELEIKTKPIPQHSIKETNKQTNKKHTNTQTNKQTSLTHSFTHSFNSLNFIFTLDDDDYDNVRWGMQPLFSNSYPDLVVQVELLGH